MSMTDKEAIEIIKNTPLLRYEGQCGLHSELGDAMRLAVEALEKQTMVNEILHELKEYKNLEEQGLLLRLPCKLWDKLYWISDQDYEDCDYEPIEEVEVCEISFNGYSIQLWFSDKGVKEFPVLPSVAIGNELFLTKAEAEATLEKMKGEKL